MPADWRDLFVNWSDPSDPRNLAHPDSPVGGAGPGFSKPTGPKNPPTPSPVPHPDSPVGKLYPYQKDLGKNRTTTRIQSLLAVDLGHRAALWPISPIGGSVSRIILAITSEASPSPPNTSAPTSSVPSSSRAHRITRHSLRLF